MLYKLLSNERVVLSHPPLQAALPVGRKTERRWNVHVRAVFAPATDTAPLRDNLSTSLRTSSSLLTKGPSAPHVRVSPARAPVFTAHAQYPHRFFPRLPYQFPSICQYTTFPIETVRYVSFASFLISSVDVHLFLIYFSPFKTYCCCYYALPPGSNKAALPRSIDPGKTCRYLFVYLSYVIRGISLFFSWGVRDWPFLLAPRDRRRKPYSTSLPARQLPMLATNNPIMRSERERERETRVVTRTKPNSWASTTRKDKGM